MRAGVLAIAISMLVGALVIAEQIHPFEPYWHGWIIDLAVALAGTFALSAAASSLSVHRAYVRFAALAAIGGAILAAAFVHADIVAGPPTRVPSAPGQNYVPAIDAKVGIVFPQIGGAPGSLNWPQTVEVRDGDRTSALEQNGIARAGPFVITQVRWPIARIRAFDMRNRPVTTTQPNGAAFLSPYLTFPQLDTDGRPVDYFSVPPLHRDVGVKFYGGLPSRGIDVPFLVLQIREQNGSALFNGVAVSGRTVRAAGVRLEFELGMYPSVITAGAPQVWVCALGIALVILGSAGYAVALPRDMKRPEP